LRSFWAYLISEWHISFKGQNFSSDTTMYLIDELHGIFWVNLLHSAGWLLNEKVCPYLCLGLIIRNSFVLAICVPTRSFVTPKLVIHKWLCGVTFDTKGITAPLVFMANSRIVH